LYGVPAGNFVVKQDFPAVGKTIFDFPPYPLCKYADLMETYLNHETEYGWYLCLDSGCIVSGLGVIENDFHDRKDLTPNVCVVYTEERYRCQGITPIYLITDHTSFYERYGWEFLCMVQGDNESDMTRMYIHK
jgi:hypothetical protein